MKNKKMIGVILLIVGIFLLGIGGYFQLFNKKITNKNNETNENKIESEEINQLWIDFKDNKITADEYVRYSIYNVYDVSLLDEKYIDDNIHRVDDLVEKYYDELSQETIELYIDYYSLANISFKMDSSTPEVKPLANKATVNLNNVYLSSNGNFLIWYTSNGNNAVDYSDVQKYAELLENIIVQYDNIFGLNYSFKSSVLSKGGRYKDQLEILNNYNIDEKFMTEAMHVYIYDLNLNLGSYHSMNETNDALTGFINNYLYDSEDGTIITPYISLDSVYVNNSEVNFENTIAHELFHHYQNYIIDNTGTRNIVTDAVIGESTAQWAAAKIAKNDLRNNSLNGWVSSYIEHTGDMFTTMYDNVGTEVGYAMARFLYSYENNVSDGGNKILKAIHSDDGFKYLNDNSTDDERTKVMEDLALKNLTNDYQNNNYLPDKNKNDILKVKKEITKTEDFSEKVNLSATGINYYSIKSKLKDNYKVTISQVKENAISVYIVCEKNGEYNIIAFFENITKEISFDTNDYEYSEYDKLYIIVTNNDLKNSHNYEINIKTSSVENDETFETNFDNYRLKATSTIEMYGFTTTSVIEGIVDELHQTEYLKTTTSTMGINVVVESYTDFDEGYTYTSIPFTSDWEKSEGGSNFIDLANILDKLKNKENVTKISDTEYKIKLAPSDVEGLMDSNDTTSTSTLVGDIYVKAFITDGYVTKLEYDFSGLITGMDTFDMVIEFYDFNKAGEVVMPK